MKRRRHTPEQIIAKLREADALLGGGASIGQVCQKLVARRSAQPGMVRDSAVRADLDGIARDDRRRQRAPLPGLRSFLTEIPTDDESPQPEHSGLAEASPRHLASVA